MRNQNKVPEQTLIRLSYYLRAASFFLKKKKEFISSKELARFLRISDHQLRKDLSYFGQFGRKGVGYSVVLLHRRIREILNLNTSWAACVVGFGNLGKAISFYQGFRDQQIYIRAAFDVDRKKIGRRYGSLCVYSADAMKRVARKEQISFGILTVPKETAQDAADELFSCGIQAVLNFTPVRLKVPPRVVVKDIDLSCQIACLAYHLKDTSKGA